MGINQALTAVGGVRNLFKTSESTSSLLKALALGVMRKGLERKNNCEVYNKCHGVLRGQTEGFSEC